MLIFRHKGIKDIGGILILAFSLFLLISLLSYHHGDPSFNTVYDSKTQVKNAMGLVGAYFADAFIQFLGSGGYFIPFIIAFLGIAVILQKTSRIYWYYLSGGMLFLFSYCGLVHIKFPKVQAGGLVGYFVSSLLIDYFNKVGAILVLVTLMIISFMLFSRFSTGFFLKGVLGAVVFALKKLLSLLIAAGVLLKKAGVYLLNMLKKLLSLRTKIPVPGRTEKIKTRGKTVSPPMEKREPKIIGELETKKEVKAAAEKEKVEPYFPSENELGASKRIGSYRLPPLSLLDDPVPTEKSQKKEDILINSEMLEKKLVDFGVNGRVVQVLPGPVVTMYEFEPASGVKVNKIVNLSDDIALVTRAANVRIVAPVPGKAVVGIEIPNKEREHVSLKDILSSKTFQRAKSKLSLTLGKDIMGTPAVTDLAQIPHLLIAGATGSGKSVALNSMICSLLFNSTPDDVKLIMIDPKMLELSIYDGIPHLLVPVVTKAKKAAVVLRNVVEEMERRYAILAGNEVRDIESFNRLVDESGGKPTMRLSEIVEKGDRLKKQDTGEKTPLQKLPYIVVVIDELADLMMVSSKGVEDSLTRLAQMARAAGIHLLVATQRPSVDVLTGVIKANFPSRISFKVASKVDSRTILDTNGGEQLLGKGDMLFIPPGTSRTERIHGAYVSEKEVKRVVMFLKKQKGPEYHEEFLQQSEVRDIVDEEGDFDEKYSEAVQLVTSTGQASISMIQRRLRVGYNRAARMVELMEKEGVVGPADGVKPRKVFGKGDFPL